MGRTIIISEIRGNFQTHDAIMRNSRESPQHQNFHPWTLKTSDLNPQMSRNIRTQQHKSKHQIATHQSYTTSLPHTKNGRWCCQTMAILICDHI